MTERRIRQFAGELPENWWQCWEMLSHPDLADFQMLYDESDVKHKIEVGLMQLWTYGDETDVMTVMVTELSRTAQCQWATILALAGDMSEAPKWLEYVRTWAKVNGCSHIQAYCRDSVMRYLRKHRFKKAINLVTLEV